MISIRQLMLVTVVMVVACEPTAPEKELNLSIKVKASEPTFFEVRAGEQQIRCTMTFTGIPSGSDGVIASWDGGERRWFTGNEPDTPWQVDVLTGDAVGEFWQASQFEEGTRITTDWEFWAPAPFIVEHEFRYRVDGEVHSASARQGCGVGLNEASPPFLSNVAIEFREPIEPRYSDIRIRFDVVAAGRLWEARIVVRGAFEETIVMPGGLAADTSYEKTLWIPSDAALGAPFTVSVLAVDALGQTSEVVSKTSPPIVDLTPPTIENFRLAGQWSVGEYIQLSVDVAENHQVAALEFEANAHTLVVNRTGESGPIPEFTVPPEWLAATSLTLRARDMQGQWSAPVRSLPDSFRIFQHNAYPTNTWTDLRAEYAIAWDEARNRAYVATEDGEVIVLTTPALAVADRIELPGGRIGSIDFTPDGDSLLVTFPDQGTAAFVDLQTHTIREIDVAGMTDGLRPWRAVLLDDGSVLMALSDPQWRWRSAILDVGVSSFVRELPAAIGLTIARSADRSLAAVYDDACIYLYRTAARNFGSCIASEGFNPSLSIDARGTLVASGNRVIDTRTGTISPGSWGLTGSTMHHDVSAPSGDGQSFFMSERVGVVRIRTSDGIVLERIAEVDRVRQILVSADGTELILVSEDQLSGSVPAVLRHVQLR